MIYFGPCVTLKSTKVVMLHRCQNGRSLPSMYIGLVLLVTHVLPQNWHENSLILMSVYAHCDVTHHWDVTMVYMYNLCKQMLI